MSDSAQQVAATFASACARRGLDLCRPFPVGAFNGVASTEERLPDFGREDALAILVGNTRRLWPVFRASLDVGRGHLQVADPLDHHVVGSVSDAAFSTGVRHALFFGHVMNPRPVPIQRIARESGLAALSPSHLSVHPEFGPWLALRAVAVFDVSAPPFAARPSREPCASCQQQPCVAALERALRTLQQRSDGDGADWQAWLAVRDACPIGTAERYSADQIAYHYTKNRALLGKP